MKTNTIVDKVIELADITKTGIDVALSIEKLCDPNNLNKTKSIIDTVGKCLLFGSKMGAVWIKSNSEVKFKEQIHLLISSLNNIVNTNNLFYEQTYDTLYNIDQEKFNQIITNCDKCVKSEFLTDQTVLSFWNLITSQSEGVISDKEFDCAVSKIQEYDCTKIKQNCAYINFQDVEERLINDYLSFTSQLFLLIKSTFKKNGKIQ